MQLKPIDIATREVLGWSGVHLFHALFSSCSQKVRIVLNLKGVDWTSHVIDLGRAENMQPYYLGINPRGLVPTLVVDGEVHIESNDIITLLETLYPDPPLIPVSQHAQVAELLRHEDDLHLDLRTLTFRFMMDTSRPPRTEEALQTYATAGTGTVGGRPDEHRQVELDFWRAVADHGIPDDAVKASAGRFKAAFEGLDARLADAPYLLGKAISVLDIAWLVYAQRLILAGYPLARLHPRLGEWSDRLMQNPAIAKELASPPAMAERFAQRARLLRETGQDMEAVCGF
jgi:glutathione S-transferase